MTYAVEILRAAQKQLAKIDRQAQSRIIDSMRSSPPTLALRGARNSPDGQPGASVLVLTE